MYSQRALLDLVHRVIMTPSPLVLPVPEAAWRAVAWAMERQPLEPFLVNDEVDRMMEDCVRTAGENGLEDLGVTVTDFEQHLAAYMRRFRRTAVMRDDHVEVLRSKEGSEQYRAIGARE